MKKECWWLKTKAWQKCTHFTFSANELVKGMCFDFRSNQCKKNVQIFFFYSTDTNTIILIQSLNRLRKERRSCVNNILQYIKLIWDSRDNNFINLNSYWNVSAYIKYIAHSTQHKYVSKKFRRHCFVKVEIRQKWNMNVIKSEKHMCFTWNCVEHVLYVIQLKLNW